MLIICVRTCIPESRRNKNAEKQDACVCLSLDSIAGVVITAATWRIFFKTSLTNSPEHSP